MSTAVSIFVRQCLMKDRIPFDIDGSGAPSATAVKAMAESDALLAGRTQPYESADAMFEDLGI